MKLKDDRDIKRALPFLNKVCVNKWSKNLAFKIVRDCPPADRDCMVNEVYRYVVENYKYRWDPRRENDIRSPLETDRLKGGDCEDLSIFLITLLESLGIKTYMVLTPDHVYSLACGVSMERLERYAQMSLLKWYAERYADEDGNDTVYVKDGMVFLSRRINEEKELGPNMVSHYHYDMPEQFISLSIKYHIISNIPVNIHVFPTYKDFENFLNDIRGIYYFYPTCEEHGVKYIHRRCDNIKPSSVFAIENPNGSPADVKITLEMAYRYYEPYVVGPLKFYTIKGDTCIILEPTAGPTGYPGYPPSSNGWKLAIDPITGEHMYLDLPTPPSYKPYTSSR